MTLKRREASFPPPVSLASDGGRGKRPLHILPVRGKNATRVLWALPLDLITNHDMSAGRGWTGG